MKELIVALGVIFVGLVCIVLASFLPDWYCRSKLPPELSSSEFEPVIETWLNPIYGCRYRIVMPWIPNINDYEKTLTEKK